jgi:SAM-dependent methyltransferase
VVAPEGDVARFAPVGPDEIAWVRVGRLTLVPFLTDGSVVLLDAGGSLQLLADDLRAGEHALADAPLRIGLETAGFRRQGTHPFAASSNGRDVALWIEGHRYEGDRPHDAGARWWTGAAPDAAEELRAHGRPNAAALVELAADARASLSVEQFLLDNQRVLDAAYLAASTPQGGSGFGGSAQDWRDERSILCDAIDRPGALLDVGCANGFLMETLTQWCAERGIAIEPYGIDISEALVSRARERHPEWAARLWVGNALTWVPPAGVRFDYVHALFECVPEACHGELVRHLLAVVVRPGGRLIMSHYDADRDPARRAAVLLTALGYVVAGETRIPSRGGRPWRQPSAWIEAP